LAATPLEIVSSQHCEFNSTKGMAVADEEEAVHQHCQNDSYKEDPSVEVESLFFPEMLMIADDAEAACKLAHCYTEVLHGAEVPCIAEPIGYVMDSPTACVSCIGGLQATQPETLPAEHTSPAREKLEMMLLDNSSFIPVGASDFSASVSSSSSSSPSPTPRKPNWEEVRGHSKCEIEAVLSLRVVSEQLRARHGKVDRSEDVVAWATLAAAGA